MIEKTAIITGIEGQDGSYLAEHLYQLGYRVYGTCRPNCPTGNIRHLPSAITLVPIDLADRLQFREMVASIRPNEVYHLAGPSFLGDGDTDAADKFQTIVSSTFSLLDAVAGQSPGTRFFFAGSSEMFGDALESPQSEETAFRPRSAYGLAKVCGHEAVDYFRRGKAVWCCTGFLYNHESPRRPPRFVTRKVTQAVARIKLGLQETLTLGNLSARRDWGYAPDYVGAMVAMLKAKEPRDYVISSGTTHSVADLVNVAFAHVGLNPLNHLETDPALNRPEPQFALAGNPALILRELGWSAQTSFGAMIRAMVDHDLAEARRTTLEHRT